MEIYKKSWHFLYCMNKTWILGKNKADRTYCSNLKKSFLEQELELQRLTTND